jgi:NAD(P)-dependent dehydrogenase (short-subunit alcohol dehydrogenase family)
MIRPYVGWSPYGSQKAAVDMFTKIVAKEVENEPVRVAAIAPGAVETHMQEAIRNTPPDYFPARDKFIALHDKNQISSPEDVGGVFIDIALTDWHELSGMVDDIRSPGFQRLCMKHGVSFPKRFAF